MFDNIKMIYFKNYITNEVKAVSGLPNDKVKVLVEEFFKVIEKGVDMYASENKVSNDEARKEIINKIEERIKSSEK